MKYEKGNWKQVASVDYRQKENQMEIAIPRSAMELNAKHFTFDFKWSDNAEQLEDPISLTLNGDTAPNRRFNYRCVWSE